MHDWRYDPNVQHITHSDRLGTYEELQVRSGPRVGAQPVYVTPPPIKIDNTPTPTRYGIPTSTDRIDALEREVKRQAAVIAELEAYIRDHSERDDVPFGTLRMAEDAWGQG